MKTNMRIVDEDEIFYFNSGDDIRMSFSRIQTVYNTELKSNLKFNTEQLELFFRKNEE